MKYLLTVAVLLFLAVPASAQIDGTGTLTGRHAMPGNDESEGLLPFTMSTPYGPAVLIVHESGWAFIAIPSMGWSSHGLLSAMPLPSGMENAVVDAGMCTWASVFVAGIGMTLVQLPIPAGEGPSLYEAIGDAKDKIKEAGPTAHKCVG